MQKYTTFFDRTISSLDQIESEFKISLKSNEELTVVYPELTPSLCSCQTRESGTFKVVTECDGNSLCVICQNKLGAESTIVSSYACSHAYHLECIQTWLEQNNNCPLCSQTWKFQTDNDGIRVCFSNQVASFQATQTKSEICQHFGLNPNKYQLSQNKNYVESCTSGLYGLCTLDIHPSQNQLEITLINTIKSETKKTYVKYATKLGEFKSDVANLLGMLAESMILMFGGAELGPALDDLNLFNIGLSNESAITVIANTKIKYEAVVENDFVIIHAESQQVSDNSNPLYRLLAGRLSWYPSAYVSGVSDIDVSCLLSSLYILIKAVSADNQVKIKVLDRLSQYLKLYQMPDKVKGSFELLLNLDPNFQNKDRTIVVASFYELISKMRHASGIEDETSILSESNVLCHLLMALDKITFINWNYARRDTRIQQTFTIWSPLAVTDVNVLTLDSNGMVAVYIGKNKDLEFPLLLYQPLTNVEVSENPAVLAKKHQGNSWLTDNRPVTEAIMVCLDTSNSMSGCSDFEEDLRSKKKAINANLVKHYSIWNDIEPETYIQDADVRTLKSAVIWFVTNPNLQDWKNRSYVLKQIVCLENYDNPEIALSISKYRRLFSKLLKGESVEIDDMCYQSSLKPKSYPNLPDEYQCPISLDIMKDPVVLDDGFTYERSEITKWLSKVHISPLTNKRVEGTLIPNRGLKSTIQAWIERQQVTAPEKAQVSGSMLRILRDDEESLYYEYTDDSNVYDVIYYLYSKYQLIPETYILRDTYGYPLNDKVRRLSVLKGGISLSKLATRDMVDIKIVYGLDEEESEVKIVRVPKNARVKQVIYSSNTEYDYDKCSVYTGITTTGDGRYGGRRLTGHSRLTQDTTFHFINQIPSDSEGNYFSRLDVVKNLFDAYVNRAIAYNFNTGIGLMSFSDKSDFICPITQAYEDFRGAIEDLETSGNTALYQCIEQAIENLLDWKNKDLEKRGDSKLRIICLTDGEDTTKSSSSRVREIKCRLKQESIILDCILIGDKCDKNLVALARDTGGYIFKPTSIKYGFDIMELETMVTSIRRKPINFVRPIDETVVPPMIEPNQMAESFVPSSKLSLKGKHPLRRELAQIMSNPHPDIDIYVNDSDITFWKVVFVGPSSTPYAGGCWLAYVQFPESYPRSPPEIRMVTSIRHCNISNYGRICHSILDRNYVSKIGISKILEFIYGLLLNPDVTDPLDTNLAFMYYEADGQYEASIMEYVKRYAGKTRQQWQKEFE